MIALTRRAVLDFLDGLGACKSGIVNATASMPDNAQEGVLYQIRCLYEQHTDVFDLL